MVNLLLFKEKGMTGAEGKDFFFLDFEGKTQVTRL